jgi:hypothetical protein
LVDTCRADSAVTQWLKHSEIGILLEQPRPIIGSIEHLIRESQHQRPGTPWHDSILLPAVPFVNRNDSRRIDCLTLPKKVILGLNLFSVASVTSCSNRLFRDSFAKAWPSEGKTGLGQPSIH